MGTGAMRRSGNDTTFRRLCARSATRCISIVMFGSLILAACFRQRTLSEGLLGSGIMITLSVTLSERFNDVRTFILEISQDLLNTSHPSHRIEKLLDQTYYAFSFQFLTHMCPIQLKDHQVLGRAILLILLVTLKGQPKVTFPPRTAKDINMTTLHLTTRNFPTITQGVPIPYALPIVKNHEWTFFAGVKPPANIALAVGSSLEAGHSHLAAVARWRVREKPGDCSCHW